jgi:hypothetical protein
MSGKVECSSYLYVIPRRIAALLIAMADGEYSKAIRYFRQAIKFSP